MHTLNIDENFFFILVRDTRLDGYNSIVDYLKEEYNAILTDNANTIVFEDDNSHSLFILTYSNYIV